MEERETPTSPHTHIHIARTHTRTLHSRCAHKRTHTRISHGLTVFLPVLGFQSCRACGGAITKTFF